VSKGCLGAVALPSPGGCWLGLDRNAAGQQEGTKREGRNSIERGVHGGAFNRIGNYTHRTIFEKVSDMASDARTGRNSTATIIITCA
jgi:hypothetical protein